MRYGLVLLLGLFLLIHPSAHKTKNLVQPYQFIRGADGYIFEQKKYENTDLHIKIVSHPNLMSLWQSMGHIPGPDENWTMAYTNHDEHGNCTIHIVDQAVAYTPEYLGHELAHCMYGNFHENQNVGQ